MLKGGARTEPRIHGAAALRGSRIAVEDKPTSCRASKAPWVTGMNRCPLLSAVESHKTGLKSLGVESMEDEELRGV
jgi:hypothetical protein